MAKKKILGIRKIIVQDYNGTIQISTPSLLALFTSEKIMKSYEKDPNKTYTLRELIDLMDFDMTESTMRSVINNKDYFKKGERVGFENGRLGIRTEVEFKECVAIIFKEVKKIIKGGSL